MTSVRTIDQSRVQLSQVMSDHDTNLYGTIHGGVLMKFIDDAAAATAARHCECRAVTVAVESMSFTAPVLVGDLVTATAEVTRVGRTSMTIAVTVQAAPSHHAVPAGHVAHGILTFVAIDDSGRPRAVPTLGTERDKGMR